MRSPLEISEILVDANSIEGPPRRMGEIRDDKSDVAHQWQHRVPSISHALPDVPARVRVNVGKNFKTTLSAIGPERGASSSVKRNAATLIGVGIEIVVTDI